MRNKNVIQHWRVLTGHRFVRQNPPFYHEKGILIPTSVDSARGYRSYDATKIEKARVIMRLRAMEFSIEDTLLTLFRGG